MEAEQLEEKEGGEEDEDKRLPEAKKQDTKAKNSPPKGGLRARSFRRNPSVSKHPSQQSGPLSPREAVKEKDSSSRLLGTKGKYSVGSPYPSMF